MRGIARAFGRLAALAVAAALSLPGAAWAEDFYAGKTVNFVLGFDAGDGFDAYARAISRHLARHIPGDPTLVVQYMPGAASARAAAFLYAIAPKDGLTFGGLLPNALIGKLVGDAAPAGFDANRFEYLAGAERGTRLCLSSVSSKIRTYEDARRDKMVVGATAPGGPTYDYANWHRNTTGAKFEIVGGYRGTNDLYLAVERGEVDGVCGVDWTALKTQRAALLQGHKLSLLAQDGIEPEPELTALGVPQTWGYIKDPEDRRAVEIIVGFQQAIGKFYLAPPGVPAERVAILRAAFADTLHDPVFLAEADKMGLPIKLTPGADLLKSVRGVYEASPEMLQRVKRVLQSQ